MEAKDKIAGNMEDAAKRHNSKMFIGILRNERQ